MNNSTTLQGFATISYWAADLEAAKKWYAELLGIEPYFVVQGYAEFRIGEYQHELGLIDSRYAPNGAITGPGGAIMYWHVDDVSSTLEKLLAMGATTYEAITERGEGFITASVIDPFGNILGIMYNSHFLEIQKSRKSRDSR
ncbi:VOC family protein [Paenibacillus spongiae]|uniref:VOC family protein n=1 Tax=Paenibacillus spongiae TaxID=2909671 RepID=A0ABY5SGS4_9BACL|nr:VOC family protein [Paenibacillus spongiae]UVI33182.1 VOC family protein [Paenibacillus spongiae]